MLKTLEISGHYINQKPYGEPCLSKYGLYPTLSIPDSSLRRIDIDRMLWILNYSDGSHDMMDIADKCECHVEDLRPLLEKLENAGLIK
jgi:aminopeptidase-like protein